MTKEELDFIDAKNVSDEKKLDIFKEAKFKELEEATKQKQEETKQKQEETKQKQEETEQVRITEEGLTNREKEKTKQKHEETEQVKMSEKESTTRTSIVEEGKLASIKTELNFISDRDVPDEKKLDIFKETKFKKIEENEKTNRAEITEREKTNQTKIIENGKVAHDQCVESTNKHKATTSIIEHIILGLIDGYVEHCKTGNFENTEDDIVEDIEYTN